MSRERPRDDAGDTLIEVLVALAILGIGVVAIVGGLSTQVIATGVNRDQAQANTVLNNAAEYVKAQKFSGSSGACGLSAATPITDSSVVPDSTWTVTEGPVTDFDSGSPCSSSGTTLARVPLSVSGHGETLTLVVVKRP